MYFSMLLKISNNKPKKKIKKADYGQDGGKGNKGP